MLLLSQGRPAEIAGIDFTVSRREVHSETHGTFLAYQASDSHLPTPSLSALFLF